MTGESQNLSPLPALKFCLSKKSWLDARAFQASVSTAERCDGDSEHAAQVWKSLAEAPRCLRRCGPAMWRACLLLGAATVCLGSPSLP